MTGVLGKDERSFVGSPLMWWGLCSMAVVALSLVIRTESFWIDEITSALLANQNQWTDLIVQLGATGSEAQMPLYVAWLWGWAQLFGTGEWVLRASNIPWAIMAVLAWMRLIRRRQYSAWSMGFIVSPFLCYYMNEARPYVMTFASSMLALDALDEMCDGREDRRLNTIFLVLGLGMCTGASMLNMLLVPILMGFAALRMSGRGVDGLRDWMWKYKATFILLVVMLAALAGYYGLTLVHGHGGQWERFSWLNVCYVAYEMMGFGGLGAPRILLRELSVANIAGTYAVTLGLGLGAWLSVMWLSWRCLKHITINDHFRASVLSLAVGAGTLVAMAVVSKASLWGRHFMVLLPFLFLALGALFGASRQVAPVATRMVMLAIIGLFVVSSVRQRVLPQYMKDPLREAMAVIGALASHSPELPVILITTPQVVKCYDTLGRGRGIFVMGWPREKAENWQNDHPSYMMLVHRADKFDPVGCWPHGNGAAGVKLLWHSGNIRIFRVSVLPGREGDS